MSKKKFDKPRVLTTEEVREQFLHTVRLYAAEWAGYKGKTDQERCDGLAFSILAMLDGGSASLPGFQMIPAPHPEDKKFDKERGENWYPAKGDIGGALHEEYYKQR